METVKANYESFLVHNVSTISTLESSLRSVTWFLPGRFKDAELASEALTALLNVTSMYHDTLLARIVKANPSYRPLIPSSLHSRFTRAWSDKNDVYKWAGRALEIIRFTELVLEMALRRKVSQKTKWRSIILLEFIKATLRVLLLRITQRPVISPPIPERDFDPSQLPSPDHDAFDPSRDEEPETPEHLQNNRVPVQLSPILSPHSTISAEDFLLPKALTSADVKPSLSLVRKLAGPRDWLAETVHILRPLIYASLLYADRNSKERSKRALTVVILMEFLSRFLRRTPTTSGTLERAEYARRDKDMLWYMLRGSIWEEFTRPRIHAFAESTSRAPLLGLVGSLVKDWLPLIDDYYYYTAP
ncbi:peroxisome membrane protein [Crepidotus variabilis]|uniref:Peroxisomal membrane protein PEX16 n=1 Tax=Crepidotus variabilis TaxID=179855 RepID=A0A9P6EVD2_9AGAR|nr:peroxisome membrane protein [Crepidotus variabilis]